MATLYEGKLLNAPIVTEQLSGGRLAGKSVDLEFSNADGTFSTERDSGNLAIGNVVQLDHYLPDDPATITRAYIYGKITAIDIPGEVAVITVEVEDPGVFSQLWPSKVYATDDWCLGEVSAVDFDDYTISSYGSGQDVNPVTVETLDDGYTLHLVGNTWKKIAFPYTLTANTVLEFDFKSTVQGEVHSIGFDSDNDITTKYCWQVYGTQTDGYQTHNDYSGSSWTHYTVDVGAEVTGAMSYMVFIMDDDASSTGESYFRNICVYESNEVDLTPANGTTKINPSADLGRVYPVGFGRCRKVRAVYVFADYDNDQYYYIINRGVIEATNSDKGTKINVYRDDRLVDTDEYTVYDGSQTSPFSGYAYIVFAREQSSGSALYEITVDYYGTEMGESTAPRNPATILEWILSDSTVGIGHSVDATSFSAAATTLSTLDTDKSIYIDGGIDEQITLQDLIDHLAEECGRSYIYKNTDDEWCIATDTYQSTSQATFGYGDNNYRNIISLNSYKHIDLVKTVTVKYAKDNWTGEFKHSLSRSVMSDGEELVYEFPLIYDHQSADLICCYMQRRLLYGNYEVQLELGMEARDLELYKPITVVQKWLSPTDRSEVTNINGDFQIREIERGLYQWKVIAYTNDSDIYTYSAATLPTDPDDDTITDYSFTAPSAPTGLAVSTSGSRQGSDGGTYAYYRLSCTPPSVNCQYVEFGFKQKNATNYQWTIGTESSGTWYGMLEAIIPGQYYYFAARAINNNNADGFTQGELAEITNSTTGYLAPGDTTGPDTPDDLVVTAGTGKSIILDWTDNSEDDLSHYNIYRHTSDSFAEDKKIAEARVSRFTDTVPAYATTYYYWLKAVDKTGNPSDRTSTTANTHATSNQIQEADVEDDAITAGKINVDYLSSIKSYTGSLTVTSGYGITVQSGGDITLEGTTSNINYLKWKVTSGGTTKYIYEACYYDTGTSSAVYVVKSDGNKTGKYYIGASYTGAFDDIVLNADTITLGVWGASSSYWRQVVFDYTANALYPNVYSGGDMPNFGTSSYPWGDMYVCDGWYLYKDVNNIFNFKYGSYRKLAIDDTYNVTSGQDHGAIYVGDVVYAGALVSSSWTLNTKDKKISDLITSCRRAYEKHDGSELDPMLQTVVELRLEDKDADNKFKTVISKKVDDVLQVAILGISELYERVDNLEKAKL